MSPNPSLARLARIAAAVVGLLVLAIVGPALPALGASPAAAPTATPRPTGLPAGLTFDARVLLDGHVRSGTWMAIEVSLANDGPALAGEVRLVGGTQGRTRFSVPVDLPTTSRKSYTLYAQAPSFGSSIEVSLVVDEKVIGVRKVAFALHDPLQLVVGVVAEQPGTILASLAMLSDPNAARPAVAALRPEMLPVRPEAWAPLDRLIWQDVDASVLSAEQLAALRTWVAGGGRLVIVGGTGGPATLGAFPDDLLPYRPAVTVDAEPADLRPLVGTLPPTASPVAALAGRLDHGRALAESGGMAIAADASFGSGTVTLIGFDPSASWIAQGGSASGLWAQLVPVRSSTRTSLLASDDSGLVSLLGQLPAVALPPVGGLLLLLLGYVILVGPVNYLVLRRLDRREWAWITMPLLIVGFTVAAFAYGTSLRGSAVIVNEVAIVRGAPGTDAAQAQVYFGVFSPDRATYDVRVPGGALLSAPYGGETFGQGISSAGLDVVQADPSRVRDLAVAYGSLRAIRGDTPVSAPAVAAELRVEGSHLKGSLTNTSDRTLLAAALVLGTNVATLGDIGPGQTKTVDLALAGDVFGRALSERVFGAQVFPAGPGGLTGAAALRDQVRRQLVDQLTYDPFFGGNGTLPSDGPVLLAWAGEPLVPVEVEGNEPQRTGDALFYVPLALRASGQVTFTPDLVRSTVVQSDAQFFNKDPFNVSMGLGSAVIAYRPIAFDGRFEASRVLLAFNTGGLATLPPPASDVEPGPAPSPSPTPSPGATAAPVVPPPDWSGLPAVEVLDVDSGTWRRLPDPISGTAISIRNPARFVDPASGTLQLRFVNDRADGVGFQLAVQLEGVVR
jgi:hypothetical protein